MTDSPLCKERVPNFRGASGRTFTRDHADMNALCGTEEHRSESAQIQLGTSKILRSHINEGEATEMVGHRMSLYEQLTVSSHTFANFSDKYRQSFSSCAKHSVITAMQHPTSSIPVPTPDKALISTCQFFGAMKGSVECENISDDPARCLTAAGNDIFSKSMAVTIERERTKKIISNNFLGLLDRKASCKNKEKLTSVVPGKEIPGVDMMMLVKGAEGLSIGDGLCSLSSSKDKVFWAQSGEQDCKMVFSTQPSIQNESGGRQDAEAVKMSAIRQSVFFDWEGSSGKSSISAKDENHAPFLCGATFQPILQGEGSKCAEADLQVALSGQDTQVKTSQEKELPISGVKVCKSIVNTALKTSCRMQQDPALRGAAKCKVTELSLDDVQMKNNMIDAEADYASSISPKSVIQTVGQLRFWKARLALLRQQQIFSDQVFELHKLIEVQRLLAETPYVPMSEIYYGVGNLITDHDSDDSTQDIVETEDVDAESFGCEMSTSKQGRKVPLLLKEDSSRLCRDRSKRPSTLAIVECESKEKMYSGIGSGPWAPHETVQPGVYPSPSSGPGLRPGSCDGGLVAAAAPQSGAAAGGSQLCSPKLSALPSTSRQSSHGSAQSCVPHESISPAHKVSESWRFPNIQQHGCEAPVGSTMMKNGSGMLLPQVQTEHLYRMNSLKAQGYEKDDNLCRQNADMTSQCHSLQQALVDSMVRPPENTQHYPRLNKQGNLQSIYMQQESNVQGKVNFNKEIRGLKRPKGKKMDQPLKWPTNQQVDGVVSMNPSLNALNLFPLAPIITSEFGITRPSGGGMERQGQVVKAVPRAASSASESAAEILLSLQKERRS